MTEDTEMDLEYEAGKREFCKRMRPKMPLLRKYYSVWGKNVMDILMLCEREDSPYMSAEDATNCIQYIKELSDERDGESIPSHLNEAMPELSELDALKDEIDDAIKAGDSIDPDSVKTAMLLLGRQMNFLDTIMKETGMM